MELRSIPSMLRMVSMAGHMAFVSRISAATEPGLVIIDVRGLAIRRDLALATRGDFPLAPPAEAFRSELLAGD